VILGFFSSGVLVVINRSIAWAADSALRMQALEVARENMEKLLASQSVEQSSESGESEEYPGINWETRVETFYEPITSRMWVQGICSAEYEDADGEVQKIELTHWLTNLTKEQILALGEDEEAAKEALAGQIFETLEEAAVYAGVDVETVERWVNEGGLQVLPDGSIPKKNLDTYADSGGNPTPEQKAEQITSPEELAPKKPSPDEPSQAQPGQEPTEPLEKKVYTEDDLRKMGVPEELIKVVLPLYNDQ
jgi:hypothetical protein